MIYDREELHNCIIAGKTLVELTQGRNKGKKGIVVYKGMLRNYSYNYKHTEYAYDDYFDLTILSDNKKIHTSCNNIRIC
jgi:hypothetical protein